MSAIFPAKLTSKCQLTLPAKMRSALNLRPGDSLRFVEDANGRFWVEPVVESLADLRGIIKTSPRTFTSADIAAMIAESRSARGKKLMPKKRGNLS